MSAVTTISTSLGGKYLTFILSRESYGIPVLKVREIIRLASITAVPQMPPHVKGVINLRGKIIPVIDLCVRFGLPHAENDQQACIVVVQVTGPKGCPIHLGLTVDGVEEVSQIANGDIEEAPQFGTQVDTGFILGMAKVKGGIKTLLDIDQAVGATTLTEALATAEMAAANL